MAGGMTTIKLVLGSLRAASRALAVGALFLSNIACGQAAHPSGAVAPRPASAGAVSVPCPGGQVSSDQALASLAGCTVVLGDLRIRSATSLRPLSSLRVVRGKLDISKNPHLRTLAGLDALVSVGRLSLRDNASLVSLRALSRLHSADAVVIEGAPQLTGVEGLGGITSLETLAIEDTAVTRLDGLRNLAKLEQLILLDNRVLVSAAGLGRIENAEFIDIRGNTLLYGGADEFLPRLTWATEAVLSDNSSMTRADVAGFRRRVAIAPAEAKSEHASR